MEDDESDVPSCFAREEEEISDFLAGPVPSQLCRIASNLRKGVACEIGESTEDDGDLSLELNFSDGMVWEARTPLLTHCFFPEETLSSKVAALKVVKERTKIPVPEVYHHALASDPGNDTDCSFVLLERMPGEALHDIEEARDSPEGIEASGEPERSRRAESTYEEGEDGKFTDGNETAESEAAFENRSGGRIPTEKDLANAERFHEQLTDYIIGLASLTFDHIGSLQQNTQGQFYVAPYIQDTSTDLTLDTVEAFKSLKAEKGPFSTVSGFYNAQLLLRKEQVQVDPWDSEAEREKTLKRLDILGTLIPAILSERHEQGPFVLAHDTLSSGNILVDEELNITGIVGFSGKVVPVQSFCVYPELFADPYDGPIWDKKLFYKVFTTRESANKLSALCSSSLREELLDSSEQIELLERCVAGHKTWLEAVLPELYESVHGKPMAEEEAAKSGLTQRG